MGYPSYLNMFFNKVKSVISYYGIIYQGDVTFFTRNKNISTYSIKASSGIIYITVDTQILNGTIHFDKIFKTVNDCIKYEDFSLRLPALKKQFESFSKDKEIFNALVTEFSDANTTYGYLLDLLEVSLVFKISVDDNSVDEDNFIIRYNKAMSYSKIWMLDKFEYIFFEKNYDFNYVDGNLVYDGDYKTLYEEVSAAYHLNDPEFTFKNFKNLAQLTLMKIY